MCPRRLRLIPLTIIAAVSLSACFTGQRPEFSTDTNVPGTPTGDASIDAVLAKLDSVAAAGPTFTAGYDVLTKFGSTKHTATVTAQGERRSITVDAVRFIHTPTVIQTCASSACTAGISPQAISDTQLTIDFYAADTAKRLRLAAASKIGPAVSRTESIAGQNASCVDLPQTGDIGRFTAVYCVLDDGVLARLDDATVAVTLTSFLATIDPRILP